MALELMSALELAKGVVGLAKNLQDLSKESNNLELKEAATELRSQAIDLKENVNEMRDKIIELEDKLKIKEVLDWNGQTFEYKKNDKTVYICNGCEPLGKYVHMTEIKDDDGYHSVRCPVCKNSAEFDAEKTKPLYPDSF